MPEVIYDTAQIYYEASGSGDALVLLHGFCEDLNIWELLSPSLTKQFKLILVDLPGHGGSEVLTGTPSIESYAEVVATVLQKENIEKCYLIGHSMGGYVALAFAERYPEMLLGIGLFHSQPFPDDEARKEARLKAKKFVLEVSSSKYVEELMGNLFSAGFKQKHPEVVSKIINRYKGAKPEGIIYALDAMRTRMDRTEVLKSFKKSVLCIVSEKDGVIPYQKSLEMSYMAPATNIIVLNNSSHMGMVEEPENALNAINNWMVEKKVVLK